MKKTHTDRYLNVSSHHHLAQKIVVLKTLITLSIQISTLQFLEEEKNHLTKTLMSNGYSLCLKLTDPSTHPTNPNRKPPHTLPLVLYSLFLIAKAPLIRL
jgi:hypothetical protein